MSKLKDKLKISLSTRPNSNPIPESDSIYSAEKQSNTQINNACLILCPYALLTTPADSHAKDDCVRVEIPKASQNPNFGSLTLPTAIRSLLGSQPNELCPEKLGEARFDAGGEFSEEGHRLGVIQWSLMNLRLNLQVLNPLDGKQLPHPLQWLVSCFP